MALLTLDIVTPTRKLFSGEVSELKVPGYKSELGVLPSHADLVSILVNGIVECVHDQKTKRFAIRGGFVQINEDSVLILADDAKTRDERDKMDLKTLVSQQEDALVSIEVNVEERERLFEEREWTRVLEAL